MSSSFYIYFADMCAQKRIHLYANLDMELVNTDRYIKLVDGSAQLNSLRCTEQIRYDLRLFPLFRASIFVPNFVIGTCCDRGVHSLVMSSHGIE